MDLYRLRQRGVQPGATQLLQRLLGRPADRRLLPPPPGGVYTGAPPFSSNFFRTPPPIVAFPPTGLKDTARNARHSGDFVANIVSEALAEAMNISAIEFPPEESEFTWSGLTP